MTTAKQLVLLLVKEIIADKNNRHISPDYALLPEINAIVRHTLQTLVADGTLIQRSASVNRFPAFQLTKPIDQ